MTAMTANNRKVVIVKDSEPRLPGAVFCPMEEFCSVVFEGGTWIHFEKVLIQQKKSDHMLLGCPQFSVNSFLRAHSIIFQ
jgi:hypothetical protein